jgi:hypothetical protein
MGPLAGLELGPDALNLMGARQGAVRVANAVRADIFAAATVGRRPIDVFSAGHHGDWVVASDQ